MKKNGTGEPGKKTNAMRMLDRAGIFYTHQETALKDGFTSGSELARMVGQDPDMVFKTLVVISPKGVPYVCVIPVDAHLDLKKAAKHFQEKKLDMLPMKQLLPLTGYVHGGCSPLGMKKPFPSVIDETAVLHDRIYVSGGRIGLQICLNPEDLAQVIGADFEDVIIF